MTEQVGAHFTLDLVADRVPDDWVEQIRIAGEAARHVVAHGRGPGSEEPEETAGLDYFVLTGTQIQELLPWLWEVYQDPRMTEFISELVHERVYAVQGDRAINVNFVRGKGGRYEKHRDHERYKAVLYVTPTTPTIGGGLAQWDDPDAEAPSRVFYAAPGEVVVQDGHAVPHAVLPLQIAAERISVPMCYSPSPEIESDSTLDAYIHGGFR